MYEHPLYTQQSIADINNEFNQQAKTWLATLELIETTFGISKQRQRQLIKAGRVPGVTKLDDRNYIYRRAEAFAFYEGYAQYNNVDTSHEGQETYVDPISNSIVVIPEGTTREIYFDQWYHEQYDKYLKPYDLPGFLTPEQQAEYNSRVISFSKYIRDYQMAILGRVD